MKREGYGIKSYESAVKYLNGQQRASIDDFADIVKSDDSVSVILDGYSIVKLYENGTIEVDNKKFYTARFKRYISEFVPVKLKQKEFQWYLGEQIFFSKMICLNGEWKRNS